jgi:hypothetical protein
VESFLRIRLAAAAGIHPRTIERYISGERVLGLTRVRLLSAARRLRLLGALEDARKAAVSREPQRPDHEQQPA